MAYKFQLGPATLSGALDQEGSIDIIDDGSGTFELKHGGATILNSSKAIGNVTTVSGSGQFSALNLSVNSGLATIASDGDIAGVDGTFTGNFVASGASIDLGDATSDVISVLARFDTDLVPSTDNARDLGSSTLEWKDLYVDGTGYIDAISTDGITNSSLTENRVVIAGSSGVLEDSGNLTFDGADLDVTGRVVVVGDISGSGDLDVRLGKLKIGGNAVTSNAGELNLVDGAVANTVVNNKAVIYGGSGQVTVAAFSATGDVDLGNATTDTITATGRFDSDLVPSTDSARDLGASGLEWKDLYIDGVAYIDALEADTAKIGDLTSTRVVFAGASGELTDSAALTFDGADLVVSGRLVASGAGDISGSGDLSAAGISGSLEFAVTHADNSGIVFSGPYNNSAARTVSFDLSQLASSMLDTAMSGSDSIAIYDSTANAQKKATLTEFAQRLAGSGLTATNGVLSTQGGAVNIFTGAGALAEGYNLQDATTSMTMTLPEGSPGDVVHVKAGNLGEGAVLTVARNAGTPKNIDGVAGSIYLESPRAAVSLVYISDAKGWFIV